MSSEATSPSKSGPSMSGPFTVDFVLGSGRCGSTLVHEVLSRHPDVGFVSNIEDRLPAAAKLRRFNRPVYDRLPPDWTRKGRVRFAPSEGYNALDREVSPLLTMPVRDLLAEDVTPWLEKRFRTFFETRGRVAGRPCFLHKLTGWPRSGFIRGVFPEARFVNVVRDGRAVANSWVQMDWWLGHRGPEGWQWGPLPPAYAEEWEASGRSFTLLAGLGWKIAIDAFEAARALMPAEQWLDIRYEDVVADPPGTMKLMLEFFGLEPNEQFDAALARYEFGSGRSQAYRKDLDARSLSLLDESLAGHLERYGYA